MQLVAIALEAGKEFEASDLGTLCLTSFGEKIVQTINLAPEEKMQYLKEFEWMWSHPREVPFELIAFCMHQLKWQEFKAFIEHYRSEALLKNDWRAESPTSTILKAYEEPWEDRDLFF